MDFTSPDTRRAVELTRLNLDDHFQILPGSEVVFVCTDVLEQTSE